MTTILRGLGRFAETSNPIKKLGNHNCLKHDMKEVIEEKKYPGVKNKTVDIYCPKFSPNIGQSIFGGIISIFGC